MKFIKLLFRVSIYYLFFSSCNNQPSPNVFFDDGTTQLFILDITEGRCPSNVTCVWAGNASIDIRVENGNNSADIILNTYGDDFGEFSFPSDTIIFDTLIELISLDPTPISNEELEIEDYTIEIEISY